MNSEIKLIEERLYKATESFNEEDFNKTLEAIERKKFSKETIYKEINELSSKISTLFSRKRDLEVLKENVSKLEKCPTCLQYVSEEHKHSIFEKVEKEILQINRDKNEIDNEKANRERLLERIIEEIKILDESKLKLQTIKVRLQTIQEDSQRKYFMEKQIAILNNDVSMLEKQIKSLKESISQLKKFDKLLEIKTKELNQISNKETQLEIKKAQIMKEIDINEKEIELIKKEIKEKESIKEKLIYLNELESWLSVNFLELIGTIEKNVMIKLKSEFSKLFNEWFSILVPDTFIVRLDDEFTPIIEQHDYELDYIYLSGGERTAIALAYRLALNQTINSMLSEIKTKGVVILDEPTEGFSQAQLDKMRDVLSQLNVNQLILVSHDQKIESFVDHIIRLKKVGGVSIVQ